MDKFPGSRWWKVDLHSHTPASVCYGKDHPDEEELKKYQCKEWLFDYMSAEIDCVAITDHNCGHAIDEFKNAYSALKEEAPFGFRPLTIFPGVEITAHGNVHILGIFPEETTSAMINSVVDNCNYRGAKGASDDCTVITPSEVVEKIVSGGGIAIPAHVDSPKGAFTAMSGATLREFICNKLIFAMESSEPALLKVPQEYHDKKLDWAIISGSDQHYPTGAPGQKYPGSHYTWIKMEIPSWEELHQALLAHDACVLNQENANPNRHPDIYLRSIKIQNMKHCGLPPSKPLELRFSPFFNALIGGRGSGKSTVLESIRIASRRVEELGSGSFEKLDTDLKEFMQLSSQKGVMLADTSLKLEFFRRGKAYRLNWEQDGAQSLEELENGEWVPSVEGDILERFPISLFSQKQIFTLASEPKGLLAIIDRVPEVDRSEWQGRWDTLESTFLQQSEMLRELNRNSSKEAHFRAQLGDIQNDMRQYEEQGHGDVLLNFQYRKRQLQTLPLVDSFDNLAARIDDLFESICYQGLVGDLFKDGDTDADEIKSILKSTVLDLAGIGNELLVMKDEVDKISKVRTEGLTNSAWYAKVQLAEADYKKLTQEYEQKGQSITDYEVWVQKCEQCAQELINISEVKAEAIKLKEEIFKTKDGLVALRKELFGKRKSFIEKHIGSNRYVQMELVEFGDMSNAEHVYREIFSLSANAYETTVFDSVNKQGLLWDLVNFDYNDIESKSVLEFLSTLRDRTEELISNGKSELIPEYVHGKFPGTLQAKFLQQPSCLDRLLCWWPEDLLRVKHGVPGKKKYEELDKGSAGQKSAAILAFLLSYGDHPLVVDQPEDDLDSELIYSLIVHQISSSKSQRQLIFVTHNANIVVNGDAELVLPLTFGGDQIRFAKAGGLGQQVIREKICNVMEGGEAAFKKRYRRIISGN